MANIIKQLKDSNGNNIYPIAYAQGGVKMDLLWTNPNPTSSFGAQTISIDLSDYSLIIISHYTNNAVGFDTAQVIQQIIPIADGQSSLIAGMNYYQRRKVSAISNTGVTFNSGQYIAQENNGVCIPQKIYGIKMTYIVPTVVQGLQYVEV